MSQMTYFKYGKPIMVKGTPSTSYNAGDVIVQGTVPLIAHEADPVSTNLSITIDALAAGGGVYTVAADQAYPVGTYVYWNPITQQVTALPNLFNVVPFGFVVGGPTGQWSDGGPTGSGSYCDVLHAVQRIVGNVAVGAGAPIAGNAADTTDDILWGIQVPANVFDVAGRQLDLWFQGQTGATTNNKRFKVFANATMVGETISSTGIISGGHVSAGTPILDSGAWLNGTTANSNVAFSGNVALTKYGAYGSNTQITGNAYTVLGGTHTGMQAAQPLTLPENAVINLVITGSSYTTGAANDVTLQTATLAGSN
jgi:hypothetical protein